ncbi:uncharacterized protein CLUP02_15530 [Colletotrichum lupini]|uniref:Uncharacterized protein n=1 Tax=Colletotrichum lupini TaxID=145971 RepID=A0A9Q8T637_9PEZI|nr:uncharacterized protein CLUP02_15530 [Colletotrichum lupini]UQC89999.1 hypothetical protein CLUP02_15530 [Colletotrichum lupini]
MESTGRDTEYLVKPTANARAGEEIDRHVRGPPSLQLHKAFGKTRHRKSTGGAIALRSQTSLTPSSMRSRQYRCLGSLTDVGLLFGPRPAGCINLPTGCLLARPAIERKMKATGEEASISQARTSSARLL